MDLILWRHAEAEDSDPDFERRLTGRGQKQANQMAHWLKRHLPEQYRLLVSPTKRTQQTARALSNRFEVMPELAVGASREMVLAASGWPHAKGTVVVVGHQPSLGQVAAWLLGDVNSSWSVKKSAIWWLSNRVRHDHNQTLLKVMVCPDFL